MGSDTNAGVIIEVAVFLLVARLWLSIGSPDCPTHVERCDLD